MIDLDLVSADQLSASDILHTYMRDDGQAASWPDHFLCCQSAAHRLHGFRSLDSGSNLSNRSPIACFYSMDLASILSPVHPLSPLQVLASCEKLSSYRKVAADCLPQLPNSVVDGCDPICSSHHSHLDKFCDYLTSCL